jgi:hypothetical protein
MRSTSVRVKRRAARAILAVALIGSVIGAVACVDPRADYDDFVNRTGDIRGVTNTTDAAVQEAAAIDGGFTQAPFLVACLPRLVGGNVLKALRFAAKMSYTPNSTSTKAGKLDLVFTPLAVSATDMSGQVGAEISSLGVTVRDDGRFDAPIGATTVLAAANPISANDIGFSDITLRGDLLRSDFACAELDGTIILPQMLDLNDPGDFCVFLRVADLTAATPTPKLDISQFQHCP